MPQTVVRDVLGRFERKPATHRLIVDMPATLPAAMIDRIRIERVLHNLVENAIKYSPKGGEVKVFGRQQDGQLVVGVSDQGIGIPVEEQSKLFQRFQRLGASKMSNVPGFGLGLRVCRILVEAHGGRIWVESAPGSGSTFYFTVPAAA